MIPFLFLSVVLFLTSLGSLVPIVYAGALEQLCEAAGALDCGGYKYPTTPHPRRPIHPQDQEPSGPSRQEIEHTRESAFQDANERGASLYSAGQYESAIDAFKEALELRPDDDIILANIQKAEAKLIKHQRLFNMEARIQDLHKRLDADIAAIKRLKLDKKVEDFEEWEKLAEEQRKELAWAVADQVAGTSIESLSEMIKAGKSLNVVNVHTTIAKLRQAGVTDPFLEEALKKVAAIPGKPEMAKQALELLDRAKYVKDGIMVGKTFADSGSRTAALEALIIALKYGLTGAPPLLFFVEGLEGLSLALYSYASHRVIRNNVERLTLMSENDLKSLPTLFTRVKRDVDEIRKAKENHSRLQDALTLD